jgi:hypothetical protein
MEKKIFLEGEGVNMTDWGEEAGGEGEGLD